MVDGEGPAVHFDEEHGVWCCRIRELTTTALHNLLQCQGKVQPWIQLNTHTHKQTALHVAVQESLMASLISPTYVLLLVVSCGRSPAGYDMVPD